MFQKLLWLSVAGACGTVSRFALCELAERTKTGPFPLGTLTVNMLGSFLFGLVYVLAQRKLAVSHDMRVILLTGFMGAFTTFSAFAFDTAHLMKSAQWLLAFANVFAQVGLGILALVAGVLLGRML